MIGKISNGGSFSGCLDYITRKKQDGEPLENRVWRVLGSDGVRLRIGENGWRRTASSDMERPTLMRSKIKEPCGHISLGFSPEDRGRMTDDFMLQVAEEYMEKMGIANTPYIIVRHTDKEHPHCHIMFSRVDNNGKIIKSASNFYRNKAVCDELTQKYGLTMGADSLSLDPNKLRGSERSRVEIRQIASEVLADKSITDWRLFQQAMQKRGVIVYPLKNEETGKIKTVIYKKGRHSFVASKIGKQYTLSAMSRNLGSRQEAQQRNMRSTTIDPNNRWIHLDGSPVAPEYFAEIPITREQQQDYIKGRTIHVGDVYIRFDPETKQPDVSRFNHDIMHGGGMPFSPNADPEYSAFYADLSEQFKAAFRRFRKSHPGLTNSEAMSMFKTNYGHSQKQGLHQ